MSFVVVESRTNLIFNLVSSNEEYVCKARMLSSLTAFSNFTMTLFMYLYVFVCVYVVQ